MVNVISGGAHAGGLVDVQDFLVVPIGAATLAEAIEWASRVRAASAAVLRARGHDIALVADEGGLAARLPSNRAALDVLLEGIERSGLEPATEVAIAVDIAATQLLVDDTYVLASENRRLRADELVDEIAGWVGDYPIVSIEDVAGEDDLDAWRLATARLADRIQLLGDDLFVTSPTRLGTGIREGIANAVLVKPNQIGTLTEAHQVVVMAQAADYATVLSGRSARPRTAGSPISRSAGARASSRSARRPAPSAPRNGTGCCASSRNIRPRRSQVAAHSLRAWRRRVSPMQTRQDGAVDPQGCGVRPTPDPEVADGRVIATTPVAGTDPLGVNATRLPLAVVARIDARIGAPKPGV